MCLLDISFFIHLVSFSLSPLNISTKILVHKLYGPCHIQFFSFCILSISLPLHWKVFIERDEVLFILCLYIFNITSISVSKDWLLLIKMFKRQGKKENFTLCGHLWCSMCVTFFPFILSLFSLNCHVISRVLLFLYCLKHMNVTRCYKVKWVCKGNLVLWWFLWLDLYRLNDSCTSRKSFRMFSK